MLRLAEKSLDITLGSFDQVLGVHSSQSYRKFGRQAVVDDLKQSGMTVLMGAGFAATATLQVLLC
jgi:Na+-translocating ferredoxin:NAD+ oxidoreductase RnfC subunit